MILFFYQGFVLRRVLWLPRLLARTPLKRTLALPTFQPADLKRIAGGDRGGEYDVLLFPGCVLTYFYPRKIVEIKSLLEKQGLSVLYPPGLQCCGFPYLSQGWGGEIRRAEKKERGGVRALPLQAHRRPLLHRRAWPSGSITTCRAPSSWNWVNSFLSTSRAPRGPGFRRPTRRPLHLPRSLPQPESLKLQHEARHFLEQVR